MAASTYTETPEDELVPGYFLLKVEVKEKVDDDPANSRLARIHYVFCELAASVNFDADGKPDGNPWMSQEALERLLEEQKQATRGIAEITDATVLVGPGDARASWTVAARAQSKQSFPSQSFDKVPKPRPTG